MPVKKKSTTKKTVKKKVAKKTIAKKKGIQEMVLNARENAISFYLSMGYKETGPYNSDTDIPHITMRKKLT